MHYHDQMNMFGSSSFTLGNNVGSNVVAFTLSLINSANTSDLVSKLSKNCTWIVDDLEYKFLVEQCTNKINENGIDKEIIVVKISLDAFNANNMLTYIFEQLYKIGYGLELNRERALRVALNVGTERYYLERANAFIKALRQKGDEPLSIDFQMLNKICFEIPDGYRDSLVYKIARKLQSYKLYKCTRNMIALYRGSELCKSISAEVDSQVCDLDDAMFSKIQRMPEKYFPSKFLAICTHKSYENYENIVLFEFAVNLYNDREKIISCLSCEDLKAELKMSMAVSTFLPQYDVVRCFISRLKVYELLDKIFMKLCRNGVAIDVKAQYDTRSNLALNKLDDYIKFASYVIALIASDDPSLFELNWLARMSYELPSGLQSRFVFEASMMLRKKLFFHCALSLCILYREDPLCPELLRLVDDLQMVINARAAITHSKVKENETQEEKTIRLETGIKLIIQRAPYSQCKNQVNKMFCNLAEVGNDRQDVISLFDPNNLDHSFRQADKLRYDQKFKLLQFSSSSVRKETGADTSLTSEKAESLKSDISKCTA